MIQIALFNFSDQVTCTIEDLIQEYFDANKDNSAKRLDLLGAKGVGQAVKHYVEKNEKLAVTTMVNKQMTKIVQKLNTMDVDSEEAFDECLKMIKDPLKINLKEEEKEAQEILASAPKAEYEEIHAIPESDQDDDEFDELPKPKRGRGRGRAAGQTRGRGRGTPKE